MAFTNVLPGSNLYPELMLEWAPTSVPTDASQTWVDITSRLRAWRWGYGRHDILARFDAGSGSVILDNRDRAFDPSYNAGPWFGNIKPRRMFRLRARWNGVIYPIFVAYAERFPQEYPAAGFDSVVQVDVADAYMILNGLDLSSGFTRPAERSDLRIAAVADALGIPVALRDFDVGTVDVAEINVESAGTSGLAHARAVAHDAEFGQLFTAKDGKLTFHNRHRRLHSTNLWTFTDSPGAPLGYGPVFTPEFDAIYWWNQVRISGTDNEAAVGSGVAINQTGVDDDYPLTLTISSQLTDGGDRQALAEWQLALYAEPQLRAPALTLIGAGNPSAQWPAILDLEVSDRITINRFASSPDPMTLVQNVEGISHSCQPGGPWTTTVPTSRADTNTYWQLEHVTRGQIDSTFRIAA